jgi:hypothetical protein
MHQQPCLLPIFSLTCTLRFLLTLHVYLFCLCALLTSALDGDISPMHLYKATAMLMGFPSPVANVHLLAARTEASIAAKKGERTAGAVHHSSSSSRMCSSCEL